MQINRLLEMVYILLDKKKVTAKELAEHFDVSQRTIFRDLDILSGAGIPVYTNKGKGGGISLLDNFVLNKSMLSDKEQIDILSSLQGLNALSVPDVEPVLKKLVVMFNRDNTSWIDVDFSHWGSNVAEREKFNILKTAILNRNVVTFDYFSSNGEKTERTIEPLKILFKGHAWYILGFCKTKSNFRVFKITRIKNLCTTKEFFQIRDIPEDVWGNPQNLKNRTVILVLRIEAKMAYRIYDEFDPDNIAKNADGSFTVTAIFPEDEWVYGYVLSYGNYAEVLEPRHIRDIVITKMKNTLKKYL